jgi:hypothetical protein
MIFEAIITVLGTSIFGAVGWAFIRAESLSTRVTVLETKEDTIMEYLKSRFDGIDARLTRIEKKQDKENA